MKKLCRGIIPVLFLLGCVNNTQTKEQGDTSAEKDTKNRFFTIELAEKTKVKANVINIEKSSANKKVISKISLTFADDIKKDDYPLSQIADSIEYIKLETTPECFLADLQILAVTQEDIIINSRHQLYRFSRSGSFLNKISRQGRGPGEYFDTFCCTVDEKNRHVYVVSLSQILKFRFNGEFVDSYKGSETGEYIFVVNDSLIAYQFSLRRGDEPYSLVVCNFNGDTVYTKRNDILFKMPPTITGGTDIDFDKPFFRYGDEVFFKEVYSDTVFQLSPDSLTPRFKIELGPYQIPPELVVERIGLKRYYEIAIGFLKTRIEEDDNYLYIGVQTHFPGDKKITPFLYDKDDGELYHLIGHDASYKSYMSKNGFVNDIDGTFSFWPDYVSPDGEMSAIVDVLRVVQMQEYLKNKTVERLNATRPNPQLYKMIKEFTLYDNPIIAVVPKSKKISK